MKTLKESIIISGEICSGKSTLAQTLKSVTGTPVASFGSYLNDFCEKNNLETTRENKQKIGEGFVKENPHQFLLDVIAFSGDGSERMIFEGVRHKSIFSEINSLSAVVKLIYIDAEELTRFNRHNQRNPELMIDLVEFRLKCQHPVELEIRSLISKANLVLDGNRAPEEMLASISESGIILL